MTTKELDIVPVPHAFALPDAHGVYQRLIDRMTAAVKGRRDVIDLLLVALFADGHVLLEDYPGSGKTLLAKTLGESIVDDHREVARSATRGGSSGFAR